MRLGDQILAISKCAEEGIDVAVISDVIAEIGHRRFVERAAPNGVHAECGKVGKAPPNAVEIAHPVAVGVETNADRSGK